MGEVHHVSLPTYNGQPVPSGMKEASCFLPMESMRSRFTTPQQWSTSAFGNEGKLLLAAFREGAPFYRPLYNGQSMHSGMKDISTSRSKKPCLLLDSVDTRRFSAPLQCCSMALRGFSYPSASATSFPQKSIFPVSVSLSIRMLPNSVFTNVWIASLPFALIPVFTPMVRFIPPTCPVLAYHSGTITKTPPRRNNKHRALDGGRDAMLQSSQVVELPEILERQLKYLQEQLKQRDVSEYQARDVASLSLCPFTGSAFCLRGFVSAA